MSGRIRRDYSSPSLAHRRLGGSGSDDSLAKADAGKGRREPNLFKEALKKAHQQSKQSQAPMHRPQSQQQATKAKAYSPSSRSSSSRAQKSSSRAQAWSREDDNKAPAYDSGDMEIDDMPHHLPHRQSEEELYERESRRFEEREKEREVIERARVQSPRLSNQHHLALDSQRQLAELLERAKLCIPHVSVVNKNIEDAKELMERAVSTLESHVRVFKERQSRMDANENLQSFAGHDSSSPFDYNSEHESKNRPASEEYKSKIASMKPSVTSDYSSPSLGSRSLGARTGASKPKKGLSSRAQTQSQFQTKRRQPNPVEAIRQDQRLVDSLNSRLIASPVQARRTIDSSRQLMEHASPVFSAQSGDDEYEFESFSNQSSPRGSIADEERPLYLQPLKGAPIEGVTRDFDSPSLKARSLGGGGKSGNSPNKKKKTYQPSSRSQGNVNRGAMDEKDDDSSLSDLKQFAEKLRRDEQRVQEQQGHRSSSSGSASHRARAAAAAKSSMFGFQDDDNAMILSPLGAHRRLMGIAAFDIEATEKAQEENRQRLQNTPKPQYLRKLNMDPTPRARPKSEEQIEFDGLIHNMEENLQYVQDLDPSVGASIVSMVRQAVEQLEAYSAMIR